MPQFGGQLVVAATASEGHRQDDGLTGAHLASVAALDPKVGILKTPRHTRIVVEIVSQDHHALERLRDGGQHVRGGVVQVPFVRVEEKLDAAGWRVKQIVRRIAGNRL